MVSRLVQLTECVLTHSSKILSSQSGDYGCKQRCAEQDRTSSQVPTVLLFPSLVRRVLLRVCTSATVKVFTPRKLANATQIRALGRLVGKHLPAQRT